MSSNSQRKFAKREMSDEKENVRPISVPKKSNIPCLEIEGQYQRVRALVRRRLSSDLDRPKAAGERKNDVFPGADKTSFRIHVDGVQGTVSKVSGQRGIHGKENDVQRKPLRESTIRVESRSRSISASRKTCPRHAGPGNGHVRVGPTPTSANVLRRCPVSERKPITKGITPSITRTIGTGTSATSTRRVVPSAALKKASIGTLSSVPARQRPLPTSSAAKDIRIGVSTVAPNQRATAVSVAKRETNNVEPVTVQKQRSTSVSSIKQAFSGRTTLGVPKQRSVSASPIKKDKDIVPAFEAPKQRSMSMTSLKKKIMGSTVFGTSHQKSDPSSLAEKKDSEQLSSNIPRLKQKSTSISSLTKEIQNVTIRGTSKQRSNSTEGRFTDCYKPTVDRMWYDYLRKMKSTSAVRNGVDVKECSIAGQSYAVKEPLKRLLPANNQSRILNMKNPIERLKREEAITTVLTPVDGLPEPPIPMKVSLRRKIAAKATQEVPTEFDFHSHYDDDLLAMEAEKERRSINLSEEFLHQNVNADQRRILVIFLIHVSSHCDYSTAVIYQAVKLLDVVVDRIPVDTVYLQLVALAVLWITLKREERLPKIPSATTVIALAGDLYQGRQDLLVNCEKNILMALDFNISFADPMSIFVYYVLNCKRKIDFPDSSMTTIYYYGSYIVDVTLLEVDFCRISPTILATAAAELVLCLILELEQNLACPFWAFWKNMILDELDEPTWQVLCHRFLSRLTTYDEAEMKHLKVAMVRCILRSADRHGGSEVVYKKYRRSKYGRIADRLIRKAKLLYLGLMQ